MRRYQIGRIEGRWTNFLPPIQGGKFRTIEELEKVSEEDYVDSKSSSDHETASSASSTSQSPVFEPADRALFVRQRNTTGITRASSSSSVSSIGLEDTTKTPKMTVLDRRTQQELDFDRAKYPSTDAKTQDRITQRYRDLQEKIQALWGGMSAVRGVHCLVPLRSLLGMVYHECDSACLRLAPAHFHGP